MQKRTNLLINKLIILTSREKSFPMTLPVSDLFMSYTYDLHVESHLVEVAASQLEPVS